jgi:hypothetical protein
MQLLSFEAFGSLCAVSERGHRHAACCGVDLVGRSAAAGAAARSGSSAEQVAAWSGSSRRQGSLCSRQCCNPSRCAAAASAAGACSACVAAPASRQARQPRQPRSTTAAHGRRRRRGQFGSSSSSSSPWSGSTSCSVASCVRRPPCQGAARPQQRGMGVAARTALRCGSVQPANPELLLVGI